MAIDYQIIPLKGFGGGQDSYSAPSSIQPPYVSKLLNMDTQASGMAKTRPGYEGYYGYVPLRVNKIIYTGTTIKFVIATSAEVDLSNVGSSPLVVYGKLSQSRTGDFGTSNSLVYYPSFTQDNKFTFASPSGTVSILAADSGITSYNTLVRTAVAGVGGNSFNYVYPDEIKLNRSTYQMDIDYLTASDEEVFIYWRQTDVASGTTYISSVSSVTTKAISAATHALDNFNIQVECYDTSSGANVKIIPDTVTISSTGTVTVTFSTAFTGDIILNSTRNVVTASANAGSNQIEIENPESPWIIPSVYYYDSGDFKEVIPEGVSYDSALDKITIDYTLALGTEAVEVYYSFGETIGNRLVVTGTTATSAPYTDTNPQLTIWGIPHTGIYSPAATEGGHLNHIDTYKRSGESRVMCGLGGNLFSGKSQSEAGTTYGMPTLYPELRARVNGDTNLSPLFHTTGTSSTRTRGLITDDSVEDYKARVTSASYISSGRVEYTLSFTGKTGDITVAKVDSSDYLTVSGMANAQHNGAWKVIEVVTDSATSTTIAVENTSVWGGDLDETGADGRAGVFTDTIDTVAVTNFLAGDTILSSAISSSQAISLSSLAGGTLYLSGITTDLELPDGQTIFAQRTTDVVPLRDAVLASSVTNLVRGDMLTVSGLTRKIRVKNVNTAADLSLTDISGDGTTATAHGLAAHGLTIGQRVLLTRSSTAAYNGAVTVLTTPTTSTFTFASISTVTGATGRVVGYTAELDEALPVRDSGSDPTTFTVEGRWIPVEIPTHSYDLPADTQTQHFDSGSYTSQTSIRSTTIADSMYLTSGDDEVFKFDGDSIYKAGLYRWQPQLFAQIDTTSGSGSITIDTSIVSTDSTGTVSGNRYKVDLGDQSLVAVGTRIQDSGDDAIYTVINTSADGTNGFIYVDATITDTTAEVRSLTKVGTFQYYLRALAIDANNSIVASSVTGLGDFVVNLDTAAQVKMKLLGRPNFGPYDYDRIELEIYRTKQGTSAPFYRIATLSDSFNADSRYIEFVDGNDDAFLQDLDKVSTALLGAEVGTGWDQPIRAKYLTSADNSLITANLKDYPQLDVVLRKKSSAASITAANLAGKIFTIRDDNTATGGTSFEFVTASSAVTINPATDIADNTTSFTITSTTHGLAVGDWVYLYHAAEGQVNHLEYAGWWPIASFNTNDFTVTRAGAGSVSDAANHVNRYVVANNNSHVPVLLATDGNYNLVGGNTTGTYEFLAALRLANAINTSQSFSTTPFLTAAAGSLYGVGRIILRQTEVTSTTPEIVVPTLAGTETFSIYINNSLRTSTEQVSAFTRRYPSRVSISYPNYPEIMDSPQAEDPTTTDSTVDINAADGQEVTGIISFFGDSSFGDSQKEGVVVVAKTDNIYLLNVRTREYERVDSPFGGHTAPFSLTHTNQGIVFANESGVYRLNRDLTVTWISRYADRIWKKELNREQIAKITAHNYKDGKQIKISYPSGAGQLSNNKVLVFDYSDPQRRQDGIAIGVYDNHPATGWAGLKEDSFFSATSGQVFRIRNANDATDYRDDDQAIVQELITAPENFDLPGVQKIIDGVFLEFFNDSAAVEGITVSTSLDNKTEFLASDPLESTDITQEESGYWFSLADRKGRKLQIKIRNSTKDQFMAIAGMAVRAAALSDKGTKQANST